MIEFVSDIKFGEKSVKKKYPEIISVEAYFGIKIDDKLFFEEPNFSIYEFMYFVDEWMEKKLDDMNYISIDTDENPLISFKKLMRGIKSIPHGNCFLVKI